MRAVQWFAALVLALAVILPASAALADGIIIPDVPPDTRRPEVPYLTVRYHHVNVAIDGPIAITHVDQVFVNETKSTVEGYYLFPMPVDASISEFSMTVDGRRMQGELLEREEARQIYEDIVRRQQDPALLEYIDQGVFRARIFPIPAGDERRIEIEYSQVLTTDAGLYHYSYPLSTERFSARAIEEVVIHVTIDSLDPLRAIYSPSHDVAVSREGSHSALVGYEERDVLPDRNFELYFSTSGERYGVHVLSYKPAGEAGFFLLLASPDWDLKPQEIVSRDIVFVLDTSGSMMGEKIVQAREALIYALRHLNPGDRFNVIDFSTGVRSFARRLEPADQAEAAIQYVEECQARGGTDIHRALLEALSYLEDDTRAGVIIFLTDGLPTEGVVDSRQILGNVERETNDQVQIFTFGVGYDVDTILLDSLAEMNRGASAYVLPTESIEEKVSAFYAKVSMPLLSSPTLDFGDVHVEETYPYPLPDFFLGSQLVLAGRYREGGTTTMTLQGAVNGETQRYVFDNVRFATAGGERFITRLWATRKIGHLLSQIRLHGENRELIDALVDLSIRYGIITPYTSFLVLEDEALTRAGRERIAERELLDAQAMPAPAFGEAAVQKSLIAGSLQESEVISQPQVEQVRHVDDLAFVLRDGVWIDTRFDPDSMTPQDVVFGSPVYFDLLRAHPGAGRYLALGTEVIVLLDGRAYQVRESAGSDRAGTDSDDEGKETTSSVQRWIQWMRSIFRDITAQRPNERP